MQVLRRVVRFGVLRPNKIAACSEWEPCLLHCVPPPDQGWRELVPKVEVRAGSLLRLIVSKPEPVVTLVEPDHRPEHAVRRPTQECSVAWRRVSVDINARRILRRGWGWGAWHFRSGALAMPTAIRVHKRSKIVHRLRHHCTNISHKRNAVASPPHRETVVRSRASRQKVLRFDGWPIGCGRLAMHHYEPTQCAPVRQPK